MISVEKTEHYAQITTQIAQFQGDALADLEKNVVHLYKDGMMSMILDFSSLTNISEQALTLLGKVCRLLNKESGILVIVSNEDAVVDGLRDAQIEDLVILHSAEEAVDAIFMNELENDFKEEKDDEFDMEDGFGIEGN